MTEKWKDVIGYPGYKVSSLGRIIGTRGFLIGGPGFSQKGYRRVTIARETAFIHTLVAKAFCANPENKPQVNHRDGDKLNNRADNLEWVTNQENRNHAVAMNLHPNRSSGFCKISPKQVTEVQRLYHEGFLQKEIAEHYEVRQQTISKVLL